MKTSMLGSAQRKALVAGWPLALVRGVSDEGGLFLSPGDLVRLPLCVRNGSGPDVDVVGTVMGFAVGKDGSPCAVVDAPAWGSSRMDSWRTWLVNGDFCNRVDERELEPMARVIERRGLAGSGRSPIPDAATRALISQTWPQLVAKGVLTKAGDAMQPGDLVRLPRNVARCRGSQLHAAGVCLGYAVGLDGSPCVVVDAAGEDVPALTRWRTWVVRGSEVIVIDTREAWRLEQMYTRDGRMRPKRA